VSEKLFTGLLKLQYVSKLSQSGENVGEVCQEMWKKRRSGGRSLSGFTRFI